MSDEMMNPRALVEKRPDADLLRGMISFAAARIARVNGSSSATAPTRITTSPTTFSRSNLPTEGGDGF